MSLVVMSSNKYFYTVAHPFLQCFNTIGWLAGRAAVPLKPVIPQRFFWKGQLADPGLAEKRLLKWS